MDSLKVPDVVVLLTDIPAEKLKKGSLGTVVETFDNGSSLVEFADINGVSYSFRYYLLSNYSKFIKSQ